MFVQDDRMRPLDEVAKRQLESLRRQHHALYPAYLLRLPPNEILASEEGQRFLVERILSDPLIRYVPPERGYRRGFWRRAVAELEKGVEELRDNGEDVEVDARIYEALADLMVSDVTTQNEVQRALYVQIEYLYPSLLTKRHCRPSSSYRTFLYADPTNRDDGQSEKEHHITLLEEQMAIQGGTTGLRTWTASLHLAHHILHLPNLLSSPTKAKPNVIELGAGTGFLSILVAQMGFDVISTDLGESEVDPVGICRQTPLARLRSNVFLNGTQAKVKVEHLDWSDALWPASERSAVWASFASSGPKTVVAADVIYDPELCVPLVKALSILLEQHRDNQAIIAATVRNPSTLELFIQLAGDEGLVVHDLHLASMDPDNPTFWDSALDQASEVKVMRLSAPS